VRSFDRLVFLLLTIPQLLRWAWAGRAFATATLCAVLATLWFSGSWSNVPVLDAVIRRWNDLTVVSGSSLPIATPAQFLTFAGTCLLAATFPPTTELQRSKEPSTVSTRDAMPEVSGTP
jgi:hypothetical protein